MAQSASLPGPDVFSRTNLPPGIASTMDENALPLVDQKFIYPKDWAISVTFLSFLQDRRNRLLLESIVVLSPKSHVGSSYRCSGLCNPLAIKKAAKEIPC